MTCHSERETNSAEPSTDTCIFIPCKYHLGLSTLSPGCQEHEFRCDSGECIESAFQCDGFEDCDDLSDEIGCHGGCACRMQTGMLGMLMPMIQAHEEVVTIGLLYKKVALTFLFQVFFILERGVPLRQSIDILACSIAYIMRALGMKPALGAQAKQSCHVMSTVIMWELLFQLPDAYISPCSNHGSCILPSPTYWCL